MNAKDVSRLFWAAKALLVGVLLYIAVAVIVAPLYVGRALKPRPVSGGERAVQVPVPEPARRPPADLSAIAETDLFGGSKSGTQPQVPARAPRTDNVLSAEEELGLRLVGAIAGQSTAARAVIQNTATGVALPYCIGDSVASATIESIDADRVILRHQGQRKALRLREAAAAGSRPAQGGPAPVAMKTEPSAPAAQPTRSNLPSMSYMENVFHKAKIEPYVSNGKTQGLKITGMEDKSVTSVFGLRNGDVVQAVNGQSLTSKQKAFQVLQKAKTQPRLQIQLLRDGKTKELSFDLQ